MPNDSSPKNTNIRSESRYAALLAQSLIAAGRTRFDSTIEITHCLLDKYLSAEPGSSPLKVAAENNCRF
jgi:hypothetical protein